MDLKTKIKAWGAVGGAAAENLGYLAKIACLDQTINYLRNAKRNS